MESGKNGEAEAGPSKGGVFGDYNKEETKQTEKLHYHEPDVEVEESDNADKVIAAARFVPGPLLSLKEQIEKDKEDDSLRRWKESLLGCLEEQMELEAKFHSISIISDDFGEIITPLPSNENQSGSVLFILREGSRYQLKLTFTFLLSSLTHDQNLSNQIHSLFLLFLYLWFPCHVFSGLYAIRNHSEESNTYIC